MNIAELYLVEFGEQCTYDLEVEASLDRENGIDTIVVTFHHHDEEDSETIVEYHLTPPKDPEVVWRNLNG